MLRGLAVPGHRLLVSLFLATAWVVPAVAEAATHFGHPTSIQTETHLEPQAGVHHADRCQLNATACLANRGSSEDPVGHLVPPAEGPLARSPAPSVVSRLLAGQSLSRAPPSPTLFD